MNPNEYQYPVDYLNQISTAPKRSGPSNKQLFIFGGIGIVLAILILIGLSSLGGSSTKSLPTLAARMQSLQTRSTDAQRNIKSSNLRSTNSNLSLFLTNANRELEAPLKASGIDVKKLDKNLVAREKNEALTAKLEDARLNGVYDRVYASEMNYELKKLGILMREVYGKTKNTALKKSLETTSKNLQPISDQLNAFTAASS